MNNPITVPLPQDLPTNWTYGQTVAPNGSEVGLAEQYGYNYLMKQVNAAQQAAQELGNALEGLTAEDVEAAPIGYGLGEICTKISDWNTAIKNGWYKTTTYNPDNNAPDAVAWYGYTVCYDTNLLVQTAYHIDNDTEYRGARRFLYNDVWSPWAYFQYPLKLGIEYRTTEMFGSKYVYAKAISMGNLAQGKINVAHGITNFSRAVRFSGSCSNSTCIPTELFYGQSNNYIRAYMNTTYATLEVNAPDVSDVTSITATLVMYYTKSID